MATHKEIRELLEGFALGELSERQSSEVKEHISKCRRCSDELKRLALLLECADQRRELSVDEQLCATANEAVLAASVDGDFRVGQGTTWASRWLDRRVIIAASIFFVAGFAFGFATKLLTPKERIEKIEQITKEHGFEDREYTDEDKIEISAMIKTHDGLPLPSDTSMMVRSETPRHGSSMQMGIGRGVQAAFDDKGIFNYRAKYGRIWLAVSASGYAPTFAGPFKAEPGGSISDIEIVLESGFKGQIKVVDSEGEPIEGAHLKGGYVYSSKSYHHTIVLVSDSMGNAVVEHASSQNITLQVQADGFEHERFEGIELRPDEIVELQLKKAQVTSGVVLSKQTGEPIDQAAIYIMMRSSNKSTHSGGGTSNSPETVTKNDGYFELKKLRKDSRYVLLVKAQGYGSKLISGFEVGDNLEILLGEQLNIKGSVIGDLDGLLDRDGKYMITYWNAYEFEDLYDVDRNKKVEVQIEDEIGYFEFKDVWGHKLDIRAGSKYLSVDPRSDSLDDFVIDLRPEVEQKQMREIVLTFDVPQGSPEPKGGIRIDYVTEQDRKKKNSSYKPKWLDIVDGQVHVEIPVPSRFKYSIDSYKGSRPVGYWFSESKPIDINESNEPFLIEIPVHPAGAIYGQTLLSDGSVADDAIASLIVSKKPSYIEGRHDLANSLHGNGMNPGKFNGTPLPLDGEYVIVVRHNDSYAVTEPILLDETNPIQQIDIQLAEGLTLKGQLLDTDGSPIQNAVSLSVYIKYPETGWSTKGKDIIPDENGYFAFYNVNPDFPGDYFINMEVVSGYRPVRKKVDNFDEPITVQLEKGQILKGVVIDDKTGWPVPDVEVHASFFGQTGDSTAYEGLNAESKTNEAGEFVFSNMAKQEYRLNTISVNLADPREAVTAIGGQQEPVILRIKIPERSDLKPREPDRIDD